MNFPDDYIGKVINDDCLNVLKQMPDKCVDLVLTDPPYDIGDNNKLCKQGNNIVTNKEMWGHFETLKLKDLEPIFAEIYRVCKGSLVCYYDRLEITSLKEMLKNIGYYPKQLVRFVKTNPLPHFRKNGFRSDFELAVYCQKEKGKDTFNFLEQKLMTSLDHVTIGNKDSTHPTEKPLYCFKKYVRIMSNPNDIILDPFAGSGTTLVAAELLGRKWTGIEISKEYCADAENRVKEAKEQSALFEGVNK